MDNFEEKENQINEPVNNFTEDIFSKISSHAFIYQKLESASFNKKNSLKRSYQLLVQQYNLTVSSPIKKAQYSSLLK